MTTPPTPSEVQAAKYRICIDPLNGSEQSSLDIQTICIDHDSLTARVAELEKAFEWLENNKPTMVLSNTASDTFKTKPIQIAHKSGRLYSGPTLLSAIQDAMKKEVGE